MNEPANQRAAPIEGCHCPACKEIRSKVTETDRWQATHSPHGSIVKETFPHPSGEWHWLVCACGAKHLTTGPTAHP